MARRVHAKRRDALTPSDTTRPLTRHHTPSDAGCELLEKSVGYSEDKFMMRMIKCGVDDSTEFDGSAMVSSVNATRCLM
eukprot:6198202-Pleurochrysis_carterae.AAC.3